MTEINEENSKVSLGLFSDIIICDKSEKLKNDKNKISTYFIDRDSVYLRKTIFNKEITVKVDNLPIKKVKVKENLNVLDYKIPVYFLQHIVNFFRYVETKAESSQEAMLLIGYSPDKKYFLYCPTQEVSIASVTADIGEFYKDNPGSYIVLDVHSHGSSIGAFFSGTDNKDDKRDLYSLVIGSIKKNSFKYKLRLNISGVRFNMNINQIFNMNKPSITGNEVDFNFEEAIKKIHFKFKRDKNE